MSLNAYGEFRFSIGNASNCLSKGKNQYWLPIRQGHDIYHWIDDRFKTKGSVIEAFKWSQYEPNGLNFEKCVVATTYHGYDKWNDQVCNSLRCSICYMPRVQTFYLRGNDFEHDHEYVLSMDTQDHSLKITFEGQEFSHVYWHTLQGMTEIRHTWNETFSREFAQMPFGWLKSTLSKFTNVRESKLFLFLHYFQM